jgi:hypothetical protein
VNRKSTNGLSFTMDESVNAYRLPGVAQNGCVERAHAQCQEIVVSSRPALLGSEGVLPVKSGASLARQ